MNVGALVRGRRLAALRLARDGGSLRVGRHRAGTPVFALVARSGVAQGEDTGDGVVGRSGQAEGRHAVTAGWQWW